jgi:His-Xaa-Ser system radical SAM maturase HxsB
VRLAELPRLDATFAAPFRFREVAGKVLITNPEGSFLLLEPDEFARFAQGEVEGGSPLWARLQGGNFLRAGFDRARAAERIAARRRFLHYGPNLHIVVVTLRCNETCLYCHASRADMDRVETDMTPAVAEKTVDLIFQTTSPSVTIEFQGGEPLVNFPVVKHIIEHANLRNQTAGKALEFTMVSNLALMDEDKLAYLLDHKVQVCTSIDGPRDLHDKHRKLPTASAYDASVRWIERINRAYAERGLDPTLYHVEALVTTTRETLGRWRELVDTYVALGCRALFLRPVDPFGFADKTRRKVEYPRAEYLAFYRAAVDYMLELNRRGVEILERYAAIFLTKILRGEDPNFLDIRNPSGAGIGCLAYNYDGCVFASDEGRMLHEMGDDAFLLGHVGTSRYRDLVGHETVRALVIASNRDAQPDCVSCTYNPYCGTDPIHTYKTQGSIFGRTRESTLCAVHKGIQDYLFGKLAEGDAATLAALERWTTIRARDHFLQSQRQVDSQAQTQD